MNTTNGSIAWVQQLYGNRAAALMRDGGSITLGRAETQDILPQTFLAPLGFKVRREIPERFAACGYRRRGVNHCQSLLQMWKRKSAVVEWLAEYNKLSAPEPPGMKALANPPLGEREVFLVKIWHGLTFLETASITRALPNTVAARLHHGIKRIRRAVTQPDPEAANEQPKRTGGAALLLEPEGTFAEIGATIA